MEPCKLVPELKKKVSLTSVDYTLASTFDNNHFDLHWNVKALDFPLWRFRLMPLTEFACTTETKRILFETRTFTTNPFYLESVDALRKVISESNKTSFLCHPVPINSILYKDRMLITTPQIRHLEKQDNIFLHDDGYVNGRQIFKSSQYLTTTFLDDFHDDNISLLSGAPVIPFVEHLNGDISAASGMPPVNDVVPKTTSRRKVLPESSDEEDDHVDADVEAAAAAAPIEDSYLTDFKVFGLPIELKNVDKKRSRMETFVVHPINKTIEHIDSYLLSTNDRNRVLSGKFYKSIVARLFYGDAKDRPKFTYKPCFRQIVLDEIPMTLYDFMIKVNPSSYMDHQLWNLFLLSLMLIHSKGEESFSDVLKTYFEGIIQQTSEDGIGMYKTGDMETYRLAIRLERIFLFFVLQLADVLKLEGVPVLTHAAAVI